MYCKKCGKEIPEDSKICPYCDEPTTETVKEEKPTKKKGSGIAIVAFILSFFGKIAFIGVILAIIDIVTDKNKSKKHGLAVAAIVIGALITIISYSGKPSKTVESTTASSTEISTEVKATAEEVKEDETTVEEATTEEATSEATVADDGIYEKGEEYTDGNISLTMTDCGIADSSMLSKYADVTKGFKVVYATFYAENVSDSSHTVMYTDFSGYADNSSCDQFYSLDDSLGKCGMNFSESLTSGRNITGTVAFEVPEDATTFEIEYTPLTLFGDTVIKFNVPLK